MDFYDYVLSRVKNMQKEHNDLGKLIKTESNDKKLIELCTQREGVDYAITMIWHMLEHKDYIKR